MVRPCTCALWTDAAPCLCASEAACARSSQQTLLKVLFPRRRIARLRCCTTVRRPAASRSTGRPWRSARSTTARQSGSARTVGLFICRGRSPITCADEKSKSYEHTIFIRELCVAAGALGCALWDGGVILARYIYDQPRGEHTLF